MISQFTLKRKILHIILGIIGILLVIYNIFTSKIIFIFLISGILLSLLSKKYSIPGISWFLKNFDNENKSQLPARAVIFAVAGSLLVLQLFTKDIALASIIILIFADPISHIIGKLGNTKSFFDKRKNIEGHITGALLSSLLAMFFVPFYLSLPAALTAMLFESIIIEIQKIELDDNLVIPLTAGTIMFLIVRFLI